MYYYCIPHTTVISITCIDLLIVTYHIDTALYRQQVSVSNLILIYCIFILILFIIIYIVQYNYLNSYCACTIWYVEYIVLVYVCTT